MESVAKEKESSNYTAIIIIIVVLVILIIIGVVLAVVLYKPAPPTNLTATLVGVSNNNVQLQWDKGQGYMYDISYTTNSNTTAVTLGTTKSNVYLASNLPTATTYTFYVSSNDGYRQSTPATVTVTACTVSAPTNFKSTLTDQGQVTLTWTAVTTATSYNLAYSTSTNKTVVKLGSVSATTYTTTNLPLATGYTFTITASNSTCTSPAATSTLNRPCTLTAPTDLTGKFIPQNQAQLTWSAVNGATNYEISYSTPSLTNVKLGQTSNTSYTTVSLAQAPMYTFSVTANNSICSSPAATLNLTLSCNLSAPANLSAHFVAQNQAQLTWSSVSGATHYSISYTTASGVNLLLGQVTTTAYTTTTLLQASSYIFSVVAVNGLCTSMASTYTLMNPCPIASPTNFLAKFTDQGAVQLTWSIVPSATMYNLTYSTSTMNNVVLGNTTTTNYITQNLPLATSYTFSVVARNAYCVSSPTNYTLQNNCQLQTPSSFVGQFVSQGQVRLSWSSVPGATSYILMYVVGTNNTLLTETSATAYTTVNLPSANSYNFTLMAKNTICTSPKINLTLNKSCSQINVPTPTNLEYAAGSSNIIIRWSPSPNVSSYSIYYIAGTSPNFQQSTFVGQTTNTLYYVQNLQPGLYYIVFIVSNVLLNGMTCSSTPAYTDPILVTVA